jgi:hypothetical protein
MFTGISRDSWPMLLYFILFYFCSSVEAYAFIAGIIFGGTLVLGKFEYLWLMSYELHSLNSSPSVRSNKGKREEFLQFHRPNEATLTLWAYYKYTINDAAISNAFLLSCMQDSLRYAWAEHWCYYPNLTINLYVFMFCRLNPT